MIFKTIEEFKQYISVNSSFDFLNVQSAIASIERKTLKPLLGAALYQKLNDDYNASNGDAAHLKLLDMCRYAVANLAFHRIIPIMSVQISNSGIRVASSNDGSMRPAPKWQIEKIQKSTLENGYDHLENLLEFLEENMADYPDWDYVGNHVYFINSAVEFNEYCFINSSRLIYLRMLPQMRKVERRVSNHIGKDQFGAFKAIIAGKDTDFSAAQQPVIDFIREAIANLSFADSIKSLPVLMEGNQVSIFNNQFISDFDPKVMPDADVLGWMRRQHQESGESALKNAIDSMVADLDSFPEYRDNVYEEPTEEEDSYQEGLNSYMP